MHYFLNMKHILPSTTHIHVTICCMIKAVIFDVDGVLLDSFEANYQFYKALFLKAGHKPPTRKEYSPTFYLTMADTITHCLKSKDHKEINRLFEMGRSGKVEYPKNSLKIPKHAAATVIQLSKQYKLGIVTSRLKGGLFKKPKLAKLEPCFQAVVAFEDTKKHKPNPEPLLLAARKLKTSPKDCVYVGDAEVDIQAAKAANMKIVFYSKRKLPGADAYTNSFKELPQIIKSLNQK